MCRPYIILLFALLCDYEIYSQTNAPSKIKVVKATDTNNQLIGRWVYISTKFEKNAIPGSFEEISFTREKLILLKK